MSIIEEFSSQLTDYQKDKHVSKKRKMADNKAVSTSDDHDDDFDERKMRKISKKRNAVNEFVLDEAEVVDNVVDDDDYEKDEMDSDFIDNREILDENHNITCSGLTERKSQENNERGIWDKDESEILDYINDKYSNSRTSEELPLTINTSPMGRQSDALPTENDPKLWLVKCRIGLEMETVLLLTRKCINSGQPFKVTSIVLPEGQKGWIYVEAQDEGDVRDLMNGVSALSYGNQVINFVSKKDMLQIMKTKNGAPRIGFKPKQFVRITRGQYKNDLAEVVSFDESANTVTVKLVPRIDYSRRRGQKLQAAKKTFSRAPPKTFDSKAVLDIGGKVRNDGDFQIFEGNRYKNGFLYKGFTVDFINSEGIQPTTMELERFHRETESKKISKIPDFAIGEKVVITKGPRKGITGKIIGIVKDMFTVELKSSGLLEPMTFSGQHLKKYFVVGDHVKVTKGMHSNETGMVVKYDGDVIFIISDVNMTEIKVLAMDASESNEIFRPNKRDDANKFGRGTGKTMSMAQCAFNKNSGNTVLPNGGNKIVDKPGGNGKVGRDFNDNRRHALVGKMVRVVRGPYKSSIGTVKNVTGSMAKLQFFSNGKFMSISVDVLAPVDGNGTSTSVQSQTVVEKQHHNLGRN